MKLVDVGVWLAAVWGRHVHHRVAADWFGKEADDIVFCRVTQTGLLRLLSNAAIMGDDAIDRSQAWRTYDQLWADERVLWADEPAELDAVWRTISARDDRSHQLWTDDYLAAFGPGQRRHVGDSRSQGARPLSLCPGRTAAPLTPNRRNYLQRAAVPLTCAGREYCTSE